MNPDEALRAEHLVAAARQHAGRPCAGCRDALAPLDVLYSHALGFKEAPRCAACLADVLEKPLLELRNHLDAYLEGRPCYREARAAMVPASAAPAAAKAVPVAEAPPGEVRESAAWDAGDLGCGDLVLELRTRMAALPGGAVLKVTATDPGAPEDLPAWCRMTGHPLAKSVPPAYWIRKP